MLKHISILAWFFIITLASGAQEEISYKWEPTCQYYQHIFASVLGWHVTECQYVALKEVIT